MMSTAHSPTDQRLILSDGEHLIVEVLSEDGRYEKSPHSPTFPQIPLAGIVDHLQRRGQTDETSVVRSFRAWVTRLAAT